MNVWSDVCTLYGFSDSAKNDQREISNLCCDVLCNFGARLFFGRSFGVGSFDNFKSRQTEWKV